MPHAQLRKQRIDGTDLNPRAPAPVPDIRCLDVVVPIRRN
jgi:hypothetical protein